MATSRFNEEQLREAGEFIQRNLGNPELLASKAKEFGLTTGEILAAANTVAPVTAAQVTEYFRPTSYQPSAGWSQQQLADAGNFIAQNIDNPAAIEAARANVEQATGLNISSADLLAAAGAAQKPAELSRAMADVISGDVYGNMNVKGAYDWINRAIIDKPQLSAQSAQQVMRDLGISGRDVAQAALLDPRISAGAQYALVSNPLYQQGQLSGLAALNANINSFITNALQYQTPTQARQSLENALQSGVLTAGRALNEYDVQRATGKSLNDLFKTAVQGPQVLGPLKALPDLTGSYVPPTAPPPEAPPPALTPGQEGLKPGTAIVGNIPTSAQVKIPQLDAEFRASAPRTAVYDRLGRVSGYEYTPAAKLTPATGTTVFNWTPPGVTSRPRQLLSRQDVPGATFDPVTGEAQMPLSASQRFARDRAQLDRDFRQMYAAQAAQDSSLPAQAPASAAQAFRELALSDPETAMQLKLRDIEQQRFDPSKADMAVRARYGAQPAQAAISSLFAPFINRNMATLQGLAKLQNPVTYAQRRPDVAEAYAKMSAEDKKKFPTLLDYEVYHYNTFGKSEDPTLPNPLEQIGRLQSPYATAFFSKGGEASTEDFIKKQSGGDVSRETASPNTAEVPKVDTEGRLIDEREEIRSESQRMLNRLQSQPSKLPPGLRRTVAATREQGKESMFPAAAPARDLLSGILGASPTVPGSQAYRTGQAIANMPPVQAAAAIPAKIAASAGDAATALAAMGPAMGAVMKPKGGNWLAPSVERGLNYLIPRTGAANRTAKETLEEMNRTYPAEELARMSPETRASVDRAYQWLEPHVAIQNWIEKKLTKYVKNEMATPEDPVRALAERGILHVDPEQLNSYPGAGNPTNQAVARRALSYPEEGLARSEAAKRWETASDYMIQTDRALNLLNPKEYGQGFVDQTLAANPWLTKVDPYERIYGVDTLNYRPDYSELGFDHLIDELKNSLNPDSGLPRALQLTPKQLDKVSMPQAVELVDKINKWRAEQKVAADLKRSQNAATVEYKAYDTVPGTAEPNQRGLRWVELRTPEITSADQLTPEAQARYKSYLSTGVSEEAALRQAAKYDESLAESLKYEGEVMGHCVGGYCPDVQEGRSRIYSLRDKKGEPHVTIEVQPTGYTFKDIRAAVGDDAANEMLERGLDLRAMAKEIGYKPQNQKIVQIKGKANRAPKDEYLPFVQDFVRSGNWSNVQDLKNAGLSKVGNKYITTEEYKSLVDPAMRYLEQSPALEPHRRAQRELDAFKGDILSPEYRELERRAGMQVHPDIPYTYREMIGIFRDPEAYVPESFGENLERVNLLRQLYGEEGFARGGPVNVPRETSTSKQQLDKLAQVSKRKKA